MRGLCWSVRSAGILPAEPGFIPGEAEFDDDAGARTRISGRRRRIGMPPAAFELKMSGIGRELGPWGAEEYLQVKQVHINLSEQPIGWY